MTENKTPNREIEIKKVVCTDGLSSVETHVILKGPEDLKTLVTTAKELIGDLHEKEVRRSDR